MYFRLNVIIIQDTLQLKSISTFQYTQTMKQLFVFKQVLGQIMKLLIILKNKIINLSLIHWVKMLQNKRLNYRALTCQIFN